MVLGGCYLFDGYGNYFNDQIILSPIFKVYSTGLVIDLPPPTHQKYSFTLSIINIHYDRKNPNEKGLTNSP